MKLGIALEGGGAKGAFHIGAVEACIQTGYWPPAAVAGTSIGAMNAAMIAQGDFDKARALWEETDGDDIYDPDNEALIYANFKDMQLEDLPQMWERLKDLWQDGGIDNSRLRAILRDYVDPDRLLRSPIDYGVVTVALPAVEPVEIFKEEMGRDNIHTYILASAAFPGFQKVTLGERSFVDGGLYDNCPVNMLLERGCDRVIAVRTHAIGITRYDMSDERVITITPSEPLGSLMKFSSETARHNIRLGYYDGLRAIRKLPGRDYYLTEKPVSMVPRLFALPDSLILSLARSLHTGGSKLHPRRLLIERVLPLLFDLLDLDKSAGYDDLILAMLEFRAHRGNVERLHLYTPDDLLKRALAAKPAGRRKALDKAVDSILEVLAEK